MMTAPPTTTDTLVLGLGNPILGDDAVGWRVVEEIERRLATQAGVGESGATVTLDCAALGGLALMERLAGYRRVLLVDAIHGSELAVGTVAHFWLEDLPDPGAGHTSSAHDTSLRTALDLGRRLGLALPEEVHVVAIEAARVHDFSEALTPAVAAAVPHAADLVLAELGRPLAQDLAPGPAAAGPSPAGASAYAAPLATPVKEACQHGFA